MDKDILIYMNKKIIATLLILIVFTIHSLLVKTMMNMESNHDCPLSILMTGECLADSTPIEVLSFHDHLIFTVQKKFPFLKATRIKGWREFLRWSNKKFHHRGTEDTE